MTIQLSDNKVKNVETLGLIDSGAGGKFIDQNYAKTEGFEIIKLQRPMRALNVDGTENKRGTITSYVMADLMIHGRPHREQLYVTGLGKERIILGYPWLKEQNPDINWKTGEFSWRKEKKRWFFPKRPTFTRKTKTVLPKTTIEEEPDEEESKNRTMNPINEKEDDDEHEPIRDYNNPDYDKFPGYDVPEDYDDGYEEFEARYGPLLSMLEKGPDNRSTSLSLLEIKEELDSIWLNAKMTISNELHIKHDAKKKDLPLSEQIPSAYHDYLNVFDEQKAGRFPESRIWDHKIEMKPDFVPKSFKTYNLTPAEQLELDNFLKENLEKGYIRPSQSPMASPFFFVNKKDGKLRPCQDYRYLNDWTIKNAYPLPLISEIMDKLKGAKVFTKFDVRWGYNNIRIKEGDEWKAAFKTNKGLFEPTVMFFGLCNSPATFQAMMDHAFADMIDEGILICYMDDILIYAEDETALENYTKRVLKRLQEHDLFLKPTKCEFAKRKIEYLGMVIEEGKVSMDPGKVKGIQDWPVPTTVKQVRSFLGFGNFYRRFIRKYSDLAKPLNDLLKKDRTFDWTDECQQTFEELKRRFSEEPVLMMPDHTKPFQIEADASKYASGAVLTQNDINGERHPVAFISKTFSPAERNYEIYDRELLAIIRALEEWRHYIQGSPHQTVILSDHKNLTYYRESKKLNRRQARWSLYLSEFDIKLTHVPGTKMILSDALSRRPDLCPEEDNDNEDVVVLPDHLFVNLIDIDLQQRIADADDLDTDTADVLHALLGTGPTALRHDLSDWTTEDFNGKPILFYKGKNYIPRDIALRRDIVRSLHDHETAGHPGELETYNSVRQHYWWPGLRSFVKNYVQGCGVCQQFKIDRNPSKPAFLPIDGAKSLRPFAHCSMDLITDLPLADGFDSVLVVVDQGLTKGVILLPTNKTITAEGTARLLLDNLYKRFGLPDKIISDRGPQFASHSFRELLKLLGITSSLTTAYHPQSDGATERTNQEIEAYLSIYCASNPEEWPTALHTLEFTHNNRRHADRLHTPFELMFGMSPIAIPLSFEHTKYPTIEEKTKTLQRNREEALAAHELARSRMAERRKSTFSPFKLGQKVWLDSRNLKTFYHKKMKPKREGPFEITEVLGPVTYRLGLPKSWKIHDVFHATLLRLYKENETYGTNFPQPPPVLQDGEELYEIETILNHRKRGRTYQYLVKWDGYPISEASWEPEDVFSADGDTLARYKLRHHLA
jgi:transposase InsO family protein